MERITRRITFDIQNDYKMKKAIVNFANGSSSLVRVNMSYSQGGVHSYSLTLNKLNTFLDFEAGETKTFTQAEVTSLKYIMG